mmetsp:Transcript_32586/g.104013  ORF Transcript_32586/g.104013 Transcript_32586/m.104013 type:complete len:108 (+) Transcript_32586:3884-4207(+)
MNDPLPLPLGLPWSYQKSLISASLASRMVYREGLTWVDSIPDSALPDVALQYLRQEQRIRGMVDGLRASSIGGASEISELLMSGGVRAAVEAAERSREAHKNAYRIV